jgi:hypothetical protein
VGASAVEILDYDVSAIGLKGDAVIAILNDAVLDCDAGGAVCVPSICCGLAKVVRNMSRLF